MSHTHDLFCIDGCGRKLGAVTLEDHQEFKGNAHYGLVCSVEHAPLRRQQAVVEERETRNRELDDLKAELEERAREQEPAETFVMTDDNPADQNPPVWKKVWNFIFKR